MVFGQMLTDHHPATWFQKLPIKIRDIHKIEKKRIVLALICLVTKTRKTVQSNDCKQII